MAMSTSSVNKAFAGKALTSAQKLTPRARVSRSAQVCKATQENKNNVVLKAAGAALGALAAVQLGLAGPAAADVSFDSSRSGAPAQNKDAVNLPSTFFKTGDTLQEKLGFTEDAQNQGNKVGLPSFQGINQKDVEVEKTGETAQKGLEKAGQNLIPDEIKNSAVGDTSELPNPFDGAGGIADKAKGAAKDVGKNLDPSSSNLPDPSAAVDKAAGNAKGLAADAKQGAKNVASDLSENPLDGLADKVKGSAKDVGKNLDPSSSNLPNPSAAVDKAAGNAKGLAADAKQGAKNVASDLSENPLDGLADKVKGSAKDIGKNLDPSSSNLPNPSAAVDKAAGNAKGLAADAKQGAKNVASDLSENPLDGLADKVKGSAKDVGKNLDPSSSNLPNPSAAVDKAAGNAKGLAADAKQGAKNVASDLSENPLDGLADKVKGSAKDVGKNLDPSSSNLPNPSAAVDKAAGNAKGLAADAKQGAKNVASDLSENPLDGLADKVKGTAKDIGKNLDPSSSDLPDPSAALDKAAGNAKSLASDAKSTVKKEANVAGDVSDLPNPFDKGLSNPFDGPGGLADKAKGTAKDIGKNLDPSSSDLPDPSAAVDKAAGNAKGLAADAKQGAKNVASDLSENPLDGLADKVKGTAKDVGKNLDPSSSDLPDPSAAADKAAGNLKSLGSDTKDTIKGLKANPNT